MVLPTIILGAEPVRLGANLLKELIAPSIIETPDRLERRATTKNNENQSVCDRFPIVYLLYWNFLPRLGKLLNTRWNFELGDGDARFWSAHGTSTNPFEERDSALAYSP